MRRAVAVKAAEYLQPLAVASEGEVVLDRDEPPNELYFIDAGAVGLFRDGECVASLEAGSYFGELPFVFETVVLQPFAAVAAGPAALWLLRREDFEALAQLFPELPRIMRLSLIHI